MCGEVGWQLNRTERPGAALAWIYDRSEERKRTAQLREKSLGLVVTG
jgi:hypothetical protein